MFSHIWWHMGLFHVDTEDAGEVQQLLRTHLWDGLPEAFQADFWASTGLLGLLWKLELRCPEKEEALADRERYWQEGFRHAAQSKGMETFSSPLYTLVVLRAAYRADPEGAEAFGLALLERMRSHAAATQDATRRDELQAVWVPVAETVHALYSDPCPKPEVVAAAQQRLQPVLDRLHVLGGSSEQREVVVEFVMVKVLLAARDLASLSPMVEERCQLRGQVPFLRRMAAAVEAS